jgi:predicted ATPase
MPASIQSLVLARMDRLSVEDKRALQAASVIGQHFALDALCHLLGQDRYTCAGLLKHHLVRPEGDDYLFAHALIQEGVYSSLLKATRWELHVRAADWFSEHDAILRALFDERVEVSYSVGSASALFNDGSFGALSNGTI